MPAKSNRDDFPATTRNRIARLAGYRCSYPGCRRPTIGATSDGTNEIDIGIAAHICAAAPGGPRFDGSMTPDERKSAENGIWLCSVHSKVIDSRDSQYTVEVLRGWKVQAQRDSWRRIVHNDAPQCLSVVATFHGEQLADIRTAFTADLDVFRRSDKWSRSAVPLTLEVEGLDAPVSTSALASALATLDNLIVVAPPGSGKTTMLFQIAEALLETDCALPIIVPLSEWSTGTAALFETILKRQAFRSISEDELRAAANQPGLALLLDGWNELESAGRRRATAEIQRLQMELPELRLVVTTRKQVLDIPIDGQRVSIAHLDERQQRAISISRRGEAGGRILDRALRTAGVRDLVSIPLYLTSLLELPEDSALPTTREALLRQFIAAHESDSLRYEALSGATQGFHERYLESLAATATRAVSTAIDIADARRAVTQAAQMLEEEGQLAARPQPNDVLEVLVNHHVLTRSSEPAAVLFQHQQFQEWYASATVERLMMASIDDSTSFERLRLEIFNIPAWEEAILFACERLSRGNPLQQEACGAAVESAFVVDPMLAAEMIHRSTHELWPRVAPTIVGRLVAWHSPGTIDRGLRFMIASGRPEFAAQVWPLVSHPSDQVQLAALRIARCFRTSVLGNDTAGRVATLPTQIRTTVLQELTLNSDDEDTLDLVAEIAAADPNAEVKATVADALMFRNAVSHLVGLLRGADDKTFDILVRSALRFDRLDDAGTNGRLAAAHERLRASAVAGERLQAVLLDHSAEDRSSEVVALIAKEETAAESDLRADFLRELSVRYRVAVANGLLLRANA
ncbi:MAG: hypothetical protein RL701_6406, partial [Pseudomonadota bacterium]